MPPESAAQLQLKASAQIIPTPEGFWIQRNGVVHKISSPELRTATLPAKAKLLNLLTGNLSLQQIAKRSGLPLAAIDFVCRKLIRFKLLQAPAKLTAATFKFPPSPHKLLEPILILGTNSLAQAALHTLLQCENRPGKIYSTHSDLPLPNPLRRHIHFLETTNAELPARILQRLSGVLSCQDRPSLVEDRIAHQCRQSRIPFVAAESHPNGVYVAPFPAGAGAQTRSCLTCLHLYLANTSEFIRQTRITLEQIFPLPLAANATEPAPWLLPFAAGLALSSLFQYTTESTQVGSKENILYHLTGEPPSALRHTLPQHPACPSCFPNPFGAPTQLRHHAKTSWSKTWESTPTPPLTLETLHSRLQALAAKPFGILAPPSRDSAAQHQVLDRFCLSRGVDPRHNCIAEAFRAMAVLPHEIGSHRPIATGEALDFHSRDRAEALAILECTERIFSLFDPLRGRAVTASFQQVAREALDPQSLPLYSTAQYSRKNFPFRPFNPQSSEQWIWSTRIRDGKPYLIHQDFLFHPRSRQPLTRATSNGAACHSSFHLAVLGAIYELLERDALMNVCFNRLSCPRIAPPANPSPVFQAFQALGFDLTRIDLTNDFSIPIWLGVLRDRRNKDFILVNPVAALNPTQIQSKLERELAQFSRGYCIDPTSLQRPCTKSGRPQDVKSLPDHLAFYQNRKTLAHLAFLSAGKLIQESTAHTNASSTSEELQTVLQRLHARGYDVYVIDCTPPKIRDLGLHVVKAIIPGLQPLSVGHGLAPLGGHRIFEYPRLLDPTVQSSTPQTLNPWPHPFW